MCLHRGRYWKYFHGLHGSNWLLVMWHHGYYFQNLEYPLILKVWISPDISHMTILLETFSDMFNNLTLFRPMRTLANPSKNNIFPCCLPYGILTLAKLLTAPSSKATVSPTDVSLVTDPTMFVACSTACSWAASTCLEKYHINCVFFGIQEKLAHFAWFSCIICQIVPKLKIPYAFNFSKFIPFWNLLSLYL